MRFLAILLSLFILTSCDSADSEESSLTVESGGGKLVLTNRSKQAISYLVSEEENFKNLEIWNTAQLPRVLAREKVEVPYSQILGYTPGAARAIVYWKKFEDSAFATTTVDLR